MNRLATRYLSVLSLLFPAGCGLAGRVPGFDVEHPLSIEFWDSDMEWEIVSVEGPITAIGYSRPESNELVTRSFKVMAHELMHHHLYRYAGDGDGNHEKPGGPWSVSDYYIINDVIADYYGVGWMENPWPQ